MSIAFGTHTIQKLRDPAIKTLSFTKMDHIVKIQMVNMAMMYLPITLLISSNVIRTRNFSYIFLWP